MTKDNEVKMPNDINMLLNEDSKSVILQRQEGKYSLSWIENFGLHLLEKDCKPNVSFQNEEGDMVLVLRIKTNREKLDGDHLGRDTISAYLCYFKTVDGRTRFCVNTANDEDVDDLKDLMVDKVHWTDESTKNWWKEVFRDLKHPIDEDTLRREEVLVSNSLRMNMMDFVKNIQEVIGKVISKLDVDNQKINKVCLVEQYAMALPFRYAIGRMFPNTKGNIFPFIWEEKKMPWLQNASSFHVPGKFLYTNLSISPQFSIGDILKQSEKGVVITLPLSRGENEKYLLPSSVIFDNSDLKWNELMREDVTPDYVVDNLAFKRVQISMFADGFQNVYVKSDKGCICLSVANNRLIFSKEHSKIVEPEIITTEPDNVVLVQESSNDNIDINIEQKDEDTSTLGTKTIIAEIQEEKKTADESIDYEEKADKLVFYITQGVKRTAQSLETVARNFLLTKYEKELPRDVSASGKEEFWRSKYEECMQKDWQKLMLSNWKKYKQIEYSNFYSFLRVYQHKGLSRFLRDSTFSKIDSAVSELKDIRNLNAHANTDRIISIGRTKILFSMEYMSTIAKQLRDKDLIDRLQKYKDGIEKEWDENFTRYWKDKHQF